MPLLVLSSGNAASRVALCPRDDRTPERPVFQRFGRDAFRRQLARSCTAAGVPTFSPHALRHRRVSLLHLAGAPWVRIGQEVGHADIVTTARTYTHIVADERELDYGELVSLEGRARTST